MAKRRFEFSSGSSDKFWQIEVKGSTHTVSYGRIGTDGQSKSKTHGSPAKARESAEKLIASKVKKGYVETKGGAKKKSATKAKPAKKASRTSSAKLVCGVSGNYPKESFISVWEDAEDLWVIGCDDPSKPDDVTLRDMLDGGFVQRWHFKSAKDAKAAASAIKKQKKPKKASVPDWVRVDTAQLTPLMKAKDVPMIARYEVSKSGPLTLTRNTTFDWVLPRPASRCWCGRALMPTYQLSGAIDPRLGKKLHVYVSFCPGSLQDPYCEGSIEVVVQHQGAKASDTLAYALGSGKRKSYRVVSRSILWSPIGMSFNHAVTTHFGEQGSPGTVQTKMFPNAKAADEHFKAQSPKKPATASKFGKWYVDVLAERAHFHRVPGAKPLTSKLKPIVPPADISGSPYATPSALFDTHDCVGGQPNYTQSDWSDTFDCPSCKGKMLFLFQTGSGAPWWSEQLNDGDAGSFQFFACPHCKGPHGRALFECH